MRRLVNPIRPYAWGSRTAIATLQGRPAPAPGPEAELWLGAHPSAPSAVALDDGDLVDLTEVIAADPGVLGAASIERFGPRLPYLVKVLAAVQPLSLQAHPDVELARAGFAADAAKPAAQRTYVDPYHKPELLVALTDFRALCGFRDPDASAAELASLRVAELAPVIGALRSGPVRHRLRSAVEMLLRWPAAERAHLVGAAVAAVADDPGALIAELGRRYPTDPGVLVAVLLNQVRLRPDEGVYLAAGNLHAYLDGTGIEVMAASDNVLRGGLTPKPVDVAELLRVLRFEVLADPVRRPVPLGAGLLTWPVEVDDFTLVKAVVGKPVTLPGRGPRILVCTAGEAVVGAPAERLALRCGESVFVGAPEPAVRLAAPEGAEVFQCCPGV